MSEILLKCEKLDICVRMVMQEKQAPSLCKAIMDLLPLKTLSWHAVISGDNAGFFLPLVWSGFDNPQERNTGDCFIYANGQLVVIDYDKNSEPGKVNKFAEIHPDSLADMKRLGLAVRNAINLGEEPYFFELVKAE